MESEGLERTALDYAHCRYGGSRIDFRGPVRPLDGPYIATIGGSETYGKFCAAPFPDLLEAMTGEPVVNLGCMHAGLSIFSQDADVLRIAGRARMSVVQILGAQNMSNRFYSVHPRRNDRFLGASARMQAQFPEVDFTEFNFTGHLVQSLARTAPERFHKLHEELQEAWVSRMRSILAPTNGNAVLLWLARRRPEDAWDVSDPFDPLFVDREMLEALSPHIAGIVEVSPPAIDDNASLSGKLYAESEAQAAAAMPGPDFHINVAQALAPVLSQDAANTKWRDRSDPDAPCGLDEPAIRASR